MAVNVNKSLVKKIKKRYSKVYERYSKVYDSLHKHLSKIKKNPVYKHKKLQDLYELGQIPDFHLIAKEFLKQDPVGNLYLTDPGWALGACGTVSREFALFLHNLGYKAFLISGEGFLKRLPKDAHFEWQKFAGDNRKYLFHIVVRINDIVIDLTGRQYGKKYGGIRIIPLKTFRNEWKTVKTFAKGKKAIEKSP